MLGVEEKNGWQFFYFFELTQQKCRFINFILNILAGVSERSCKISLKNTNGMLNSPGVCKVSVGWEWHITERIHRSGE